MEGYALFVDYEWCSGCKSCELACRNEHDIPRGQWGIRVLEDKPWKMDDGSMNWNYIAFGGSTQATRSFDGSPISETDHVLL